MVEARCSDVSRVAGRRVRLAQAPDVPALRSARSGMASGSRTSRSGRTAARGLSAIALVLMLLMPPAASGRAVGTPAVATTSATPAAFVPDWDGHTDSTVVQYLLLHRSLVRVRVLDARGALVATLEAGVRPAGMQLVSWDGRGSDGRVRPPGSYRVRVDARPRPAPGGASPLAASLGGTQVVAAARSGVVRLQAPPVAMRGIRLGRATLGRAGSGAATDVVFDLSTRAWVAAAIVDTDGRVIRTLAARQMRAGTNRLRWNGTGSSGPSPDGEYALVVAATGAGRPTATTRLPLFVDRTSPTIRTGRSTRAGVGASGIRVPLHIAVDEQVTLSVRAGRRSTRRALEPGSHRVVIRGDELGIEGSRRGRVVSVRIVVADGAGNQVARSLRVHVPPVVRITPRPTPPPPPASSGTGRLAWPVGGVVTSGFGMRAGRLHTGIDIAVPAGTPIHPAASGTVSYVGVLGGYGNLVIVDHAGGLRTWYAHMSTFGSFGVGGAVAHADVIGQVGCTGSCTGPHVHFETRVGDVPRDPRSLLVAR